MIPESACSATLSFQDLAHALKQHFELNRQSPDHVYVWLDIFSINQHVSLDRTVLSTVADVLRSTEKV